MMIFFVCLMVSSACSAFFPSSKSCEKWFPPHRGQGHNMYCGIQWEMGFVAGNRRMYSCVAKYIDFVAKSNILWKNNGAFLEGDYVLFASDIVFMALCSISGKLFWWQNTGFPWQVVAFLGVGAKRKSHFHFILFLFFCGKTI